jgi:hypothetical protein
LIVGDHNKFSDAQEKVIQYENNCPKTLFLIKSNLDDFLFWSVKDGWVDYEKADHFSQDQINKMVIPDEGDVIWGRCIE